MKEIVFRIKPGESIEISEEDTTPDTPSLTKVTNRTFIARYTADDFERDPQGVWLMLVNLLQIASNMKDIP